MSRYQDRPCVCVYRQDKNRLSTRKPGWDSGGRGRVCRNTHGVGDLSPTRYRYATTTVWYQHNTLHYMEWLLDTITVCNYPGGGVGAS